MQRYEQVADSCLPQLCPPSGSEELLQRIWEHKTLLPEWDIKAGINSAGLLQRMRIAVSSMVQGQAIKIAVIGGSPTAGVGTVTSGTYLAAFKAWLQRSFPAHTPEVVERSIAKASAGIATRCLAMQVQDADIVILELLHDETHSTEEVHKVPGVSDFDMVLRQSLLLPKRPAVVILSAATVRPSGDLTLFYHIPENDKLVLAQYYGVPLLSLRGATYHHTQALHMSAQLNLTDPDSQEARELARRVRTDLGPEKYQRFLADILISFFGMAITNVLTEPVSTVDSDVVNAKLLRAYTKPSKRFRDRWTVARGLGQCLLGSELTASAVPSSGSNWEPHVHIDGTLPGLLGAGDLAVSIDATGASVIGIGVWTTARAEVKVACISGCECASLFRLQAAEIVQVLDLAVEAPTSGCTMQISVGNQLVVVAAYAVLGSIESNATTIRY